MPKRRRKKYAPQRKSKVARLGSSGEERDGEGEGEGDLVKMFAEELREEERSEEEEEEVEVMEERGERAEEEDRGGGGEGVRGEGEGGKRKGWIAGLYRPPTHEELQSLKETQNLFQSNLMRLQITELLGEIRPHPSSQLDQLLGTIRTTIMAMPTTSPLDLCEALQHLPTKVHYPIDLDPSTVKGKFHFRPPVGVKVVGSYLLKTAIKPDMNVDLVLQIPQECLQAKDHLNYRYLHKRALYLCHVAAHLRKKRRKCGLKSVKFSLSCGDPLLPIIVLVAEGKSLSRYSIRLHTAIPDAPFKLTKLAPNRNNLRQHVLKQLPTHLCRLANLSNLTDDSKEDSTTDLPDLPPTPHYNSTLLLEMGGREKHLEELYSARQECPAMADAVMLYKVWARQRGLDQGYGGFGGFHFSMLVAMLLSQRKISGLMSSYQILRVALQFIASSDWTTTGITMAAPDPSLPSLSSFHHHHSVVFLDSTGYLNLLPHTSRLHYHWLRHEAASSMACLDDPASDGFQALFMTSVPFERSFDVLFHISPPDVLYSSLANTKKGNPLLLDSGTWPLPLILEQVLPVLQCGLGKRIKLMAVRPFTAPQWFLSKAPLLPCDSHVTMGLLLDPDHASSILDMGPPADSAEAAEFRVFWGEKAELRRFQDGSINEAVVWGGGSVGGRRGVVTQVVRHLLQRHAGVGPEHIVSTAGVLHPLISLPSYQKEEEGGESSLLPPTGEEVSRSIEDTFTELSKQLRGLRGLPLAITSVQGASAVFRHTDVFPLLPWRGKTPRKLLAPPPKTSQSGCLYPSCDVATPPYVPALEVVLQLETSGKWPSELTAIGCIRTSFYCYIGRALGDQLHLLSSPTEHHLDVLKSGYVFRLRIHHPRELLLLKDAISAAKPREAIPLKGRLGEMERALVQRPLLTSVLHGLSQQYPAFGPGTRLCKRWLSAHLLTNHIADEAVELMVTQLFINPAPFTAPNSPETVLLRFLSLLSLHDWESQPLIVNLNNEFSAVDLSEIGSQFSARRGQLPPCFIATPLHRDSSPWTTPNPILPVLSRARLLAKESLSLLSTQLSSHKPESIDFKQAFRSPVSDYNVLIHLHKKHLPLVGQGVDVAMVTDSTHPQHHSHRPTHIPVTDFNPAEKYLTELESAFSEFALFFYDKYGGRVIAVVWKPQAFIPQPFRMMQAYCRIQASTGTKGKKQSKAMYVPDVAAIVSDFELMGEGLVHSVQVLSSPPTHSGQP